MPQDMLPDIHLTNFVCCHLPYHTNRKGMSHSRAAAMASRWRCTGRAALVLESVSCGALLWLSQSALPQCQRRAQCQLTEVWLQKGLVRGQTAMEAHAGSRLPQNMGKILCRNKLQPRVDGILGSHNEPSRWLHQAGKKSYGMTISQWRKMESVFKLKCIQGIWLYTTDTSSHTPWLSHHHKSDPLHWVLTLKMENTTNMKTTTSILQCSSRQPVFLPHFL